MRSFHSLSKTLIHSLGMRFEVSIDYYQLGGNDVSIESYELDGDNISREELVDLFGEEQVEPLEEAVYDEAYSRRLARGSEETTAG